MNMMKRGPKSKPVEQLDEAGNVLNVYADAQAAAKAVANSRRSCSNIYVAIKYKRRSYGSFWRYQRLASEVQDLSIDAIEVALQNFQNKLNTQKKVAKDLKTKLQYIPRWKKKQTNVINDLKVKIAKMKQKQKKEKEKKSP